MGNYLTIYGTDYTLLIFVIYEMNQNDISYIVDLLSKAIKREDWEVVSEAVEYLQEFQDDPHYEEE